MDAVRFGRSIRALRRRRRWRQVDVALAAGVSQDLVSRLERGHIASARVASLLSVTTALEAGLVVDVRWQGEHLDRLLDRDHAALVEIVLSRLTSRGWLVAPEASFSIYGERGAVDILAFHPATRTVLVTEVKSVVPDMQAMLAALDRKTRLARRIAKERGWETTGVARVLVIADTTTSRARVEQHSTTLASAFPVRSHAFRSWLRSPDGTYVSALWFVRLTRGDVGKCGPRGPQRVQRPRSCSRDAAAGRRVRGNRT